MSARLIKAAETLLDAYGGDTPDWLRSEAVELAEAVEAAKTASDPWHVGELPGDDGCIIRDENGLEVCRTLSPEAARLLVADHNGEVLTMDDCAYWDAGIADTEHGRVLVVPAGFGKPERWVCEVSFPPETADVASKLDAIRNALLSTAT